MAVSPKVSIRKISKTFASLGRRRGKDHPHSESKNHDCRHGRDGASDSETLESSVMLEDSGSYRVDDDPNPHMYICPSRPSNEMIPEVSSASCFDACISPRMSSRKLLSAEDEAKVSPWSSPSLMRRRLTKLDSWLFLSSARGCTGGPRDDDDDDDNSSDSEEATSEHGDDDVVPPLMPMKPTPAKGGSFPIDRRMAMKREDSWLTMVVDAEEVNSPQGVQRLRTSRTSHKGRGDVPVSDFRRVRARPPVTLTNSIAGLDKNKDECK